MLYTQFWLINMKFNYILDTDDGFVTYVGCVIFIVLTISPGSSKKWGTLSLPDITMGSTSCLPLPPFQPSLRQN